MKRINLNNLLTVFFITLIAFFIYQANTFESVSVNENILVTTLNHEDIEGVLVKRITYKRNNLRYEKQQAELEKVLDIFKNNKDALEMVTHSFLSVDKMTGIFFHLDTSAAKFYARKSREVKAYMRCLTVLKGGDPSFRYSDIRSYLNVKNNPELENALKVLDSDIVYASVYSNYAIFTLNKRYFEEEEKINFVFYTNTNSKEYLSDGIYLGDGWAAEIVGYNQHYRDIELENNIPSFPDDAYPYLFFLK